MARGDGRTRVIPFLSLLSLPNKGRYEEWGRRENDRDRARQTEIDKETNRQAERDRQNRYTKKVKYSLNLLSDITEMEIKKKIPFQIV